jgi:WD40 repeat protein
MKMRAWLLAIALVACGDSKSQKQAAPAPKPAAAAPVSAPATLAAIVPAPPVKLPADRIHHHHPIFTGRHDLEDLDLTGDGTRIAAAGPEAGVVVVDRRTRRVIRHIAGASEDVALSSDGSRVAYTGDHTRLHDVATGKLLASRPGTQGTIVRCGDGYLVAEETKVDGSASARLLGPDFSDRGVLAIDKDFGIHGTVRCHGDRAVLVAREELFVFGVRDRKLALRIPIEPDHDPNGLVDVVVGDTYIATMANTGSVWLFDTAGKLVAHAPSIGGQAQRLALSADESVLAAGGAILGVPDLALRSRTPWSSARAITPDGAWLITTDNDDINAIDIAALPEVVDGHIGTAQSMAIDPTGRLLATGGAGRVFVWSLADAKPGIGPGPLVGVIEAHAGSTFGQVSVAFDAEGKRLFSGGNGVVAVWDAATRKQLARWPLHDGEHSETELELHVDGKHLVVAGSEVVYVFDASTYKPISKTASFMLPKGWGGSVGTVALHPDGKHFAVTSHGGKLGMFERINGKRVAERAPQPEAGESFVTITPDGKHVVELASTYGKVFAWPGLTETASFEARWISGAAWAPDGKRIALGGWNGRTVGVAEVARTGLRLLWEKQTPWHTSTVAWDGKRSLIYSTGADEGIHVWDATNGELRATWSGGGGDYIDMVTFSADHEELITHQDNTGSLRVWNMTTFEQVAHFHDIYMTDGVEPRLAGEILSAWDNRGVLRRWQRDGSTWRALSSWKPPTEYDWVGAGITADGKTAFVVGNETGELVSIDVATAKVTAKRKTGLRIDSFLDHPAFDGTSTLYATTGIADNTLELWNLAQNQRVHVLKTGDDERINELGFAGAAVIVDGERRRRWSIATGKASLDCKDDFRNALGFEANGKRSVWKAGALLVRRNGTCGDELALFGEQYDRAAAIADDRLVVTNEGQITVWDLTKREPISILRALRDGLWSSRIVGRYIAPARIPVPAASSR